MENEGLQHSSVTPRVFQLQFLKDITNNFSKDREVGRGAYGIVYKGLINDRETIAVKRLHNHQVDNTQFKNEITKLTRVQHPNIVRLLGYCYDTSSILTDVGGKQEFVDMQERALCLEYLKGGSLEDHLSDELHGHGWHQRYRIIKGICEGLKHLHTGSKEPIFHMDLKPGNILLDMNMIPKIADFGISILLGSMQTCAIDTVTGTIGYIAPEIISLNQVSEKSDVYSLGIVMIRVIAGDQGFKKYDPHRPSKEFIELVHQNWGKRQHPTMSLNSLEQVKICTEIALRCVEFDRQKRPTITQIVDKLNEIGAAESSAIGGQNAEEEEHTTLEKQPDIQEQNENGTKHLEEKMNEQVDGRSGVSYPQLQLRGPHERDILKFEQHIQGSVLKLDSWEEDNQDSILHLQSGIQRLKDDMPAMYNLIDGAEWKFHENCVAQLLPKLKDAVNDADDLLDEFRWYEMKVQLEGNASKSPFTEFFHTVVQGSYNKVDDVQARLVRLSTQLGQLGLPEVGRHFDKSVRMATGSMPSEENIVGRENELKQVMKFLMPPKNSKRRREGSGVNPSVSNDESRKPSIVVLPIVGIGGVGKTTLAQHICKNKQMKSHFGLIIWICVSDDFDERRLIKEAIQSCSGKEATTDSLDLLQRALSSLVSNKRFLIVLDDMWDDALKENGNCWKKFCAPLRSAKEGSMMLVTTRSARVADRVGTTASMKLEGLNEDDFWNFFKSCAFGSGCSNNNVELERIGKKILPKLKGSPLAAITLGHMLSTDLEVPHWNAICESELWELRQKATDILPALRLSYMYLPLYLKRCFSFCAVYPKDYIFEKKDLTEIWVAEGFVESVDIGSQYFQDLVARSFFQKARCGYVIHDLLHDMAQKVSEHDCFIIRNKNDFDKVPQNVRHIYIHSSDGTFISHLLTLSKYTKIRTIFCKKKLLSNTTNTVMENWCTHLLHMRVFSCASVKKLPDSIGNLKHLRYLEISEDCPLSIPSAFCWLYHLQILYVKKCKIESLPDDFSNLKSLRTFISEGFEYNQGCAIYILADSHRNNRLMKNLNQFRGDINIYGVEKIRKDQAAQYQLKNKKYLNKLLLLWNLGKRHNSMQQNEIEVLQLLQPPVSLMSLRFWHYPYVSLPNWFHPQNLPCLTSFQFSCCDWLDSISLPLISQKTNLNEMHQVLVDSNNDGIGVFLSLTDLIIANCKELSSLKIFLRPDYLPALKSMCISECKSLASLQTEISGRFSYLEYLRIDKCDNISSLGHFLHPDYIPSIKTIVLDCCGSLVSVRTENFKTFNYLEILCISNCPSLNLQRGLELPSTLKTLELNNCGDFSAYFPGCLENLSSLVSLQIAGSKELTSIGGNIFRNKLALLEFLYIHHCPNLVSIGGVRAVAKIRKVWISSCPKLEEADKIMSRV